MPAGVASSAAPPVTKGEGREVTPGNDKVLDVAVEGQADVATEATSSEYTLTDGTLVGLAEGLVEELKYTGGHLAIGAVLVKDASDGGAIEAACLITSLA